MKYFHTGITVKNLAESQKFFEDVFEMKLMVANERPELGIKFIMLENKHGQVLELFEHKDPKPLTEDLMDLSRVGYKHIAFEVDDIEAVTAKAIAHGAKALWPIKKGITVKKLTFIADPNGLAIELVER